MEGALLKQMKSEVSDNTLYIVENIATYSLLIV